MTQQDKIRKLATGVMGWELEKHGNIFRIVDLFSWYIADPEKWTEGTGLWNPYERWDHAGMVWEKLNESNCVVEVYYHEVTGWTCDIHPRTTCKYISANGDTGPAAICEAALATQGD